MNFDFRTIRLKKRFPLAISRGVDSGIENLFVSVTHEGIIGWGELYPQASEGASSAADAQRQLDAFADELPDTESIKGVQQKAHESGLGLCALAGLDIALWDWLGKKANLPLYQLLGLSRPTVPTSVTVGINPPEVIRERIPLLLDGTSIKSLKVKLGSPEGLEADKAMFAQVLESAKPYPVKIRVDANGGWDTRDALTMMKWLAERGVDYVEQPLAEGQEADLPEIFRHRPLPIYVDESCRTARDILQWADVVDGVNMKLMKCGGISEALNIVAVARAFGLKTMIGCMGESSMSISAAAAISSLMDHVDLDSHLNLAPDPCDGAELIDGVIMPNDRPGHGATFLT